MKYSFVCAMVLFSAQAFAADGSSLKTPNMSANTLFLYQNSNFHKGNVDPASPDQQPNGLNVQEAELQFYSDVDPYTKLNLILSVHPEYEASGATVQEKWTVEPEEAFVESIALPDVTLRLGKFKAFLGKHNTFHTHAFPFILEPLGNQFLLGDEGLNDVGLSAAFLLPTSWFSELTGQYLRGKGENAEFTSPSPAAGVGLLHWKNLVDLSDDLTMELGASYAGGGNSYRGDTSLAAGDLTFKWRPSEAGRYKSVIWATEYLGRTRTQPSIPNENGYGLATWIQYQFAERWAALYRYDNLKVENSFDTSALPSDFSERHSLALAFLPSEFSVFKVEFDRRHGGVVSSSGDVTENAVFVQANFTIGSHPAHTY